ncbi:MAG: hypothetical protein WCE78_24385, partial [Pseudonocardiaceae bacterium]
LWVARAGGCGYAVTRRRRAPPGYAPRLLRGAFVLFGPGYGHAVRVVPSQLMHIPDARTAGCPTTAGAAGGKSNHRRRSR